MRALILDDSKTMRRLLAKILGELGFDALEAANGRAGLDAIRAAGPADVALVDWHMPVMDGLEFVRAVRADPALRAMPLILVTAESGAGEVSEGLAAGANEFVMKPFTKEIIADKLALLGLPLPPR